MITVNKKTVKIGQGVGDILAAIPCIKELGGEFLYMIVNLPGVPDWHPVNHGGAQLLIPFLQAQGLDGKVVDYKDLVYYSPDIDMDARVTYGWSGSKGDILSWNSLFYGVYPDVTKPFFYCEEVEKKDCIVFAKTARYPNPGIDYRFLNAIDKEKIFIGTPAEYTYLHDTFPGIKDIKFYQIKDFYDAAKIIKSSKVFISNQTSFCIIAEGIGHPRVLEVCPQFPSVIFKTPFGRPVINQRFFEQAILELLNKE